jgi:hypothetical protein
MNFRAKLFSKMREISWFSITERAPVLQLPELQSLLYQQEGDTLFTVEYDIARQVTHPASRGPS